MGQTHYPRFYQILANRGFVTPSYAEGLEKGGIPYLCPALGFDHVVDDRVEDQFHRQYHFATRYYDAVAA